MKCHLHFLKKMILAYQAVDMEKHFLLHQFEEYKKQMGKLV